MDTQTLNPLTESQIVEAVAAQRGEAVALLSELVAQPSLLGQEQGAQALMAREFAGLGLRVHEFAIDEDKIRDHPGYSPSIVPYDGRHNVVGIHRPAGAVRGRSLILNGHIDVVPVGTEKLWTTPPFAPRIEGDKLYGRGAADMKAGIVAYTQAFRALRRLGYEPAAPVYLQSVVEEECTGNGALACLVEGYSADAAIIPEPGEGVMTAQMGVMWLTIDVWGVPVHAAYAHTGIAAIAFANHLVEALRELETAWNRPAARHACYAGHEHPINFNLGRISGGEWTSSVPTHCRVDLRLGFYPGRSPAEVRAEVEALIRAAHAAHPQHDSVTVEVSYHGFQAEGLVVDLQQPAMQALMQAHHDITGRPCATRASTATTDVRFFHLYGHIPCTCYGPAGERIHGIDEWVSLASLHEVTAVLALFIARWCGVNRRAAPA
ncbi:MAG: ArgE/DapE family deacylase [Burkholderiaceae bacterium]|nr:ArgE/DapE family deacylase [Burkholderiaceae bacterium]